MDDKYEFLNEIFSHMMNDLADQPQILVMVNGIILQRNFLQANEKSCVIMMGKMSEVERYSQHMEVLLIKLYMYEIIHGGLRNLKESLMRCILCAKIFDKLIFLRISHQEDPLRSVHLLLPLYVPQ